MDVQQTTLLPLPIGNDAPQVRNRRLIDFIIIGLIVLFLKIVNL
jgi:hypothetical protein